MRYKYEFSTEGDWECLTDTQTGKQIDKHRLNVKDIFEFLGLSDQLEIIVKDWDVEDWL